MKSMDDIRGMFVVCTINVFNEEGQVTSWP